MMAASAPQPPRALARPRGRAIVDLASGVRASRRPTCCVFKLDGGARRDHAPERHRAEAQGYLEVVVDGDGAAAAGALARLRAEVAELLAAG